MAKIELYVGALNLSSYVTYAYPTYNPQVLSYAALVGCPDETIKSILALGDSLCPIALIAGEQKTVLIIRACWLVANLHPEQKTLSFIGIHGELFSIDFRKRR